jgi:D-alanine-D-alanine ligase
MKIGLTYNLRTDYLRKGFTKEEVAEFDTEDTINAIEDALIELGYETERIGGLEELIGKLITGKRVDLVFNICEGMYGIGREAQVPAILDAYRIPYTFSDAAVLAIALHKGLTKRIVRDLGVATAGFVIVEDEADIEEIRLPFPLFAKPVAEGTGKGIYSSSKILDFKALQQVTGELLQKFGQPVLVEEYLPGREFRVGVLGTRRSARVIGAMEIVFKHDEAQGIYSYKSKANYEKLIQYRKVDSEILAEIEAAALKVWRGLGCRDAGRMDFRMDRMGRLNFLEVNPLAGLNATHSDLPILCKMYGIPFRELISAIMDSALERTGLISNCKTK